METPSEKGGARLGPFIFFLTAAAMLVFFWWLLIFDHGVATIH